MFGRHPDVLGGADLAFDSPLAESTRHQDAVVPRRVGIDAQHRLAARARPPACLLHEEGVALLTTGKFEEAQKNEPSSFLPGNAESVEVLERTAKYG